MDKVMKPVPNIPIVKLGKGQTLELEAMAILGKSKSHAKWQPCVTSYKYYPKITISDSCNACAECIEACPKEILAIKRGKLSVLDLEKCSLCKSCVQTCRFDAIEVEGIDTKFIFNIESNGSLKAEEIFIKACEILEDKAREIKKSL
jgi:DNA-directed RNA polymerase subunit D